MRHYISCSAYYIPAHAKRLSNKIYLRSANKMYPKLCTRYVFLVPSISDPHVRRATPKAPSLVEATDTESSLGSTAVEHKMHVNALARMAGWPVGMRVVACIVLDDRYDTLPRRAQRG